jgi:hypothetical protein
VPKYTCAGRSASATLPTSIPFFQWLDTTPPAQAENRSLVLFDRGDELVVEAGNDGIRFLLVSGKAMEEPVAWYGPIMMNTQEQLCEAFTELREGTFLKEKGQGTKEEDHARHGRG